MVGSKVTAILPPFFQKNSKTSKVGMCGVYQEAIDQNIALHTQISFWVSVSFQKKSFKKMKKKKVVHTRDTDSLNRCLSLNLHLFKPFDNYYFLKVTMKQVGKSLHLEFNYFGTLLLPFLLHITCHMSHDIITPKLLEQGTCIFKESALWADSF